MKISPLILLGISCIGISSLKAQEKTSLTLDEAIHLAWNKSNEVALADTKVATKKLELQAVKNYGYPDLKISGQYQRLTKASIDLKSNNSSSNEPAPVVDRLMLGQVTLPSHCLTDLSLKTTSGNRSICIRQNLRMPCKPERKLP